MISDYLNPTSIEQVEEFKRSFASNKPFKHLVMDEFFKPEFAEKMLQEFPQFETELAMNENGEVGRKAVHEKVSGIGPTYQKLDTLAKSDEFLKWVE